MEATVFYLLIVQKYISSKKDSEIKDYALCLGHISKGFTINTMKEIGLKESVKFFLLILILLLLTIFLRSIDI